ncbi:MAG: GTP-binding protein [Spirochaetales bacterium]
MKAKLALVGGFLGSGKTTLLIAVAKELIARGESVAIVTNDQGETLVDTGYAESLEITASEVGNGCFCCNFSDFVANIRTVLEEQQPSFVLAEPVGSCTDLASTVLAPLSLYQADLIELCYYGVMIDGSRLEGEYSTYRLDTPVTPREVLLRHQIAEAARAHARSAGA